MIFPDWTVVRSIPSKTWAGLLTGQYELTGGVIRHVAGTKKGGQIIAHLLPAGKGLLNMIPGLNFLPGLLPIGKALIDIIAGNSQSQEMAGEMSTLQEMTKFNSYQLMQISKQVTTVSQATQQTLQYVQGTAFLSGLSLAVSSAGFLILSHKLSAIDEKLQAIHKDIKAIKEILEQTELAKLKSALQDLLKIEQVKKPNHRDAILLDAKKTLSELNELYCLKLEKTQELEAAISYEELYCVTALAQIRCTAELGMFEMACHDMEEKYRRWKDLSRRMAKDLLLGQYRERFLASDFAPYVPISALATWLDFAYDTKKGYGWIDEIRCEVNESWYGASFTTFTGRGSGLNRGNGIGLDKEQQVVIPTLQKLIARERILDGYTSQYQMLETHKMTPLEFDQKLAQLPEKASVNGYYILQPIKADLDEEVAKNES